MPSADQNPTPKIAPAPKADDAASQQCNKEAVLAQTAAGLAGMTLPSIMALGVHLAAVLHADLAFTELGETSTDGVERAAAGWATDLLSDRAEALREVISTQPATLLDEAAVQIAVLVDFAGQMPGGDDSPSGRRINHLSTMIERLALSVLPVVAKAAGLNIDDMGWEHQVGGMRRSRFGGVGVAA